MSGQQFQGGRLSAAPVKQNDIRERAADINANSKVLAFVVHAHAVGRSLPDRRVLDWGVVIPGAKDELARRGKVSELSGCPIYCLHNSIYAAETVDLLGNHRDLRAAAT